MNFILSWALSENFEVVSNILSILGSFSWVLSSTVFILLSVVKLLLNILFKGSDILESKLADSDDVIPFISLATFKTWFNLSTLGWPLVTSFLILLKRLIALVRSVETCCSWFIGSCSFPLYCCHGFGCGGSEVRPGRSPAWA